jgi:hypothetical protein
MDDTSTRLRDWLHFIFVKVCELAVYDDTAVGLEKVETSYKVRELVPPIIIRLVPTVQNMP